MQTLIINIIMKALMKILTPEMIRQIIAKLLDELVEYAKSTKNEWDDKVVEFVVNLVKEAFNLEQFGGVMSKTVRGKRDGTGSFKSSYQNKTVGVGKRQQKGEPCPRKKK